MNDPKKGINDRDQELDINKAGVKGGQATDTSVQDTDVPSEAQDSDMKNDQG